MRKDIRIIGLDLDDTTFNREKIITPRVRQAIAAAIAKGIKVLPATGRPLKGIPEEVWSLPGLEYALTSNGAHVFELAGETTLHSDCFSAKSALELIEIVRTLDCYPAVYINGEAFAEPQDLSPIKDQVSPEIFRYFKDSRIKIPSFEKLIKESAHPVEKVTLYFPDKQERDRGRALFESRSDTCVTSSIENNLEVNTATANKGSGLLALGRKLGFDATQIMGIGDSDNDIEMLKTVGFGVAMGNAADNVKAVADHVTLSCEEDGVAIAIESIL